VWTRILPSSRAEGTTGPEPLTVPPRSPKKPVSLASLVSSLHISSFLQEAALLSGHCLLALVQATAPLACCIASMAAASTIFARCSAAFRRAGTWSLRRSSSQAAVSRFWKLPIDIREYLYNDRDLFTGPETQDMLQSARKPLVSRGTCTKSRLLSRPKSEMTLVDLMQLGVTS